MKFFLTLHFLAIRDLIRGAFLLSTLCVFTAMAVYVLFTAHPSSLGHKGIFEADNQGLNL